MNRTERVTLRAVTPADVGIFHQQQCDPEAIRMAAFVGANRQDPAVFNAHWAKILAAPENINRTILADGAVAGQIACFPQEGNLEVTYWLGCEFWGRSLATRALEEMLRLVTERPIFGRAAADNVASIRVLQKCGFKLVGQDQGFALGRGEETAESILRLDRAI